MKVIEPVAPASVPLDALNVTAEFDLEQVNAYVADALLYLVVAALVTVIVAEPAATYLTVIVLPLILAVAILVLDDLTLKAPSPVCDLIVNVLEPVAPAKVPLEALKVTAEFDLEQVIEQVADALMYFVVAALVTVIVAVPAATYVTTTEAPLIETVATDVLLELTDNTPSPV